MTDAKGTGRGIGVMLLLQLAGLMVGFVFLDALRSTEYLATAAGDAVRIRTGVIILLANCALTIGISITAWRVFRDYSQPMAMWLIIFAVFMFVMQAVDSVHIMSMLSSGMQTSTTRSRHRCERRDAGLTTSNSPRSMSGSRCSSQYFCDSHSFRAGSPRSVC
jgi:hypothetical protein